MFEMLVLLINEINPHSFCFVTCFLFIFTREALPHRIAPHHLLYYDCIFENLPWLFAAGICRGYLPREFAIAICLGFFVYVSESFFVCVSKSCLYGSKPFLYLS